MTMLAQTSSSVAMNRTRSDFSFLATCFPSTMCRLKAAPTYAHKEPIRNDRDPSLRAIGYDPPPAPAVALRALAGLRRGRLYLLARVVEADLQVRLRRSGQQSSAGTWDGTPTSQTGVVCVPSGRLSPAPVD